MRYNVFLRDWALNTVGLVYIALPTVVYAIGMLRPWIGIPAAALMLAALVASIRTVRKGQRESADEGLTISVWMLAVFACVAVLWCILCGQGALCIQMWDWFSRNATFRDLITHEWPVIYPNQDGAALSFYLGHWLPAAVIGRSVMLLTGSLDKAWVVGNVCLGLWTAAGVFIVMLLLLRRLRVRSALVMFMVVSVLVLFYGSGHVGRWFLLWKNGTVHPGPWSALFQFTSNNALLAWVFHQTVVPWIATLLLLEGERCFPYAAFVVALVPLCGVFPSVGLAWIVAVLMAVAAFKAFSERMIGPFFKSLITLPNLVGILVIAPLVAAFLLTNTAAGEVQPAWVGVHSKMFFVRRWLLFVTCEVGFYALVLLKWGRKNALYWAAFSFLLFCPLLKVGSACDFCMRSSIPALFIVMVLVLDYLLHAEGRRWPSKALLACLLLMAGWEVGQDMANTIKVTCQRRAASKTLACDPLYTYDQDLGKFKVRKPKHRLMIEFSSNILCKRPNETFFFRFLAKGK